MSQAHRVLVVVHRVAVAGKVGAGRDGGGRGGDNGARAEDHVRACGGRQNAEGKSSSIGWGRVKWRGVQSGAAIELDEFSKKKHSPQTKTYNSETSLILILKLLSIFFLLFLL